MINLRILIPDATTNYIKNPSFGYATTDWNTNGATLTRTLDQSRFGIASGKVVTTGSVVNEGIYYRVSTLTGYSGPISGSVYVRGAGRVRLRLIDNPVGRQYYSNAPATHSLSSERWTRLEVSGFSTGSNDVRLYVESADASPKAITFYVDGAQLEKKSYATSYCDGEQSGCRWNVTAHASISTRTEDTREGGRWVPLAGPCRPNNDTYVTVLGGLGMPAITNQIQSWANSPGSFFQNEKIQNRVITLSFHVKKEALRTNTKSLRPLHELRQQLIDILKSDLTRNLEAFLFEYSDTEADKPLYMRMRYEAGLEGEWDIRNGWYNSFPIRMIAVDPLWVEDTQDVKQLGIKNTVINTVVTPQNTASNLWVKKSGIWEQVLSTTGYPLTNGVYCTAQAPDGTIYIGGIFAINGVTVCIAKWDGTTLSTLGTGNPNQAVNAMSFAPDGNLYITGAFTAIGGNAYAYVAKYNPTTNTYSPLSSGLGSPGQAICVAPNGMVYIGGEFTVVAGALACYRVTRWDGVQFRTVGATSGVNDVVYTLINAGDGQTIYMGGEFTQNNGNSITYNRVASINITTNLISAMGYGVNNMVYRMAVGHDGTVYAGGNFTASGAPGASALNYAAQYSGGQIWEPLGDGFNASVQSMATGINGEIYFGGVFTLSGTKKIGNTAKWFGGNLNPIELPSNPSGSGVNTIMQTSTGDLYIGGILITPFEYPYLNTVTNNGTASCWPIMYVTGSCELKYISNNKTGQEIFLSLIVYEGEEVTIDFSKGEITSKSRGDLSYTILPGSEIRSIYLLPGDNTIEVLVSNDTNVTAQLRWQLQDWSADAVVNAEAL